MAVYHGTLRLDGIMTGSLSRVGSLSGSISVARSGGEIPSGSIYRGSYELIPDPTKAQELQTKNKFLSDNVKINKIPYFETDNSEGGKTIIIGDKNYA